MWIGPIVFAFAALIGLGLGTLNEGLELHRRRRMARSVARGHRLPATVVGATPGPRQWVVPVFEVRDPRTGAATRRLGDDALLRSPPPGSPATLVVDTERPYPFVIEWPRDASGATTAPP